MDVLILPILGGLLILFLIYFGVFWLKDKRLRGLAVPEEQDDDEFKPEPPPNRQWY